MARGLQCGQGTQHVAQRYPGRGGDLTGVGRASQRYPVEYPGQLRPEPVELVLRPARYRRQVVADPSDLLQYLRVRHDRPGRAGAQQLMAAHRHRRGHRSGYRHHGPAEQRRPAQRLPRPAARVGLDDHGAPAERGDDPVADQEARPGRVAPWRPLADH